MKKGFVLVETIAVITVLCVIMIMLFASFNGIINNIDKEELYDNTEYIYRTNIIRKYITKNTNNPVLFDNIKYCQNSSTNKCHYNGCSTEQCELFSFLDVESVYITDWNPIGLTKVKNTTNIEVTTLRYIKQLDPEANENSPKRIIVMYKDVDNNNGETIYQYASLSLMR